MRRRRNFWLAYAALQLGLALLLLASLELALRLRISRLPPPVVPSGAEVPAYYNASGVTVPKDPYDFTVEHTFNSQGFRGPELSARRPRLLFLGDSVMAGVIVNEPDTLPAKVQAALPGWDVVNGGVQGYDLWDYEGFFKLKGAALRPDYVIVGVYVNDNTRVAAQERRGEVERGKKSAAGSVLVKTLQYAAAARWNKNSPFARSKKISPQESSELSRLLDPQSRKAMESFLREYKYAAGPMVLDWLPRMLDREAWKKAGVPLKRLAAEARKREIKLAAVVFPAQFEVYPGYVMEEPHKRIAALLKEAGIPFVDLTEEFRRNGGDELFPYRGDTSHPGAKGYEIAKGEVLALMKRLRWLP